MRTEGTPPSMSSLQDASTSTNQEDHGTMTAESETDESHPTSVSPTTEMPAVGTDAAESLLNSILGAPKIESIEAGVAEGADFVTSAMDGENSRGSLENVPLAGSQAQMPPNAGPSSGGRRRHRCDFCGESFARPDILIAHLRRHTQEKPFECADCGKRFAHEYNLTRHGNVHRQERYECMECPKSYVTLQALSEHLQKFHDGRRPFTCRKCTKGFLLQRQLDGHVCALSTGQFLECKRCEHKFTHASHLYQHMQKRHPGYTPFGCSTCPARFNSKRDLNEHVRLGQHMDGVRGGSTQQESRPSSQPPNGADDGGLEDFVVLSDDDAQAPAPHANGASVPAVQADDFNATQPDLLNSIDAAAEQLAMFLRQQVAQPKLKPVASLPTANAPKPTDPSLIKVKYKRTDGKWIVVKNQPAMLTFRDFRALFSIPSDTKKRFIFQSVEDGLGFNEWTMVNDDDAPLPVLDGYITAEALEGA
ncbi:oocyte zinc finger protein XlCOF6-like [Aphelenchoides avenae]|nr:oocyte zinc finger protein XlCOF6-like [Aphelenchus avenae]